MYHVHRCGPGLCHRLGSLLNQTCNLRFMEIGAIKDYYDRYVQRQVLAGVNERHHIILDLALANGLRKDMRVLELGCGVGTLTGLLANALSQGHLVAMDLSSESIDQARNTLASHKNVALRVGDVVSAPLGGPYDMIVLPDVLEHIPLERHGLLFRQMKAALADDGHILVHSPDAWYSDWLRANRPETQQVIDLALHLPDLLQTISQADLSLLRFQRHSIWTRTPDYMALVIVHPPDVQGYKPSPLPPPTAGSRLRKVLSRIADRTGLKSQR